MTAGRPWSPVEVEVKLEAGLDALDDATAAYLSVSSAASSARAAYDLAAASAMLRLRAADPKTPKHILEAMVTVECDEKRRERDVAVAADEAARKGLDSYKTRIEALRTLLVQSRPQAHR